MVRTQSHAWPARFDVSRILALSAAIALHLLALGLLLVPLSQAPIRLEQPRETFRWVVPEIVPVTPPPPEPEEVPVTRQVSPPTPAPALAPVQIETPPLPVFSTEAVVPEFSVPATLPTTGTGSPSIAPAQPVAGVQLRYLRSPAPAYPRDALRAGLEGTVVLKVLVDTDGSPLKVEVERSSGHRVLDQAARTQVLRQWKFQPAVDGGQPVQAYGLIPIDFSLQR